MNYGPGGAGKGSDDCITINEYANRLQKLVTCAQVTGAGRRPKLILHEALKELRKSFESTHEKGNKVIFIGNGGSSAIASHMAVDFTKNQNIRAVAFNDFPTLTCLSNDFGYSQVFAKQIEYYSIPGDAVVCISTGGKSENIRNAAMVARNRGCSLYTFTGMHDDNPLRAAGDLNFYVASFDYGLVEVAHMTLLHSLCPCII